MDTNISSSPQEIVSQSEVEGLLAQIGGGDLPQGIPALENHKDDSGSKLLRPHVFRRLSSFSVVELRKLRVRHEEFIVSLAARLSNHLRLEVGLKMSRLETMPFNKFIDELSNPTYLALLKLEPLRGMCFLDLEPQLGLSIVDRELGGQGVGEDDRTLTEIESRILSKVVEITMSEWCSSWSDTLDLRPVLIGHESNGGFVQNHRSDTTMLVLGVEVQIGESIKQMQFAFPYPTLEPLIQKLHSESAASREPATKPASKALKWNPVLNDVNIRVSAALPDLKITTRELAKLKPGDVIPLEPEMLQHIRVSLAQKPKFVATAGKSGPRWAARITKILESEQ